MRWELQLAVLLGLSFTDVASLAERPPDDESLASTSFDAEMDSKNAGYFDSEGVVRFQLIQGRLQLDTPRHRKGTQHCEHDGIYESIAVTAKRGVPSVHYIHRCSKQETILSAQNATSIRIESRLTGSGEQAIIVQPSVQSPGSHLIRFTINSDRGAEKSDQVIEMAGPTLLHLRSEDERHFDRHFGQLLRQLLRGQTIQALTEKTDEAILQRIHTCHPIDVAAIHEAIDQLGSQKISVRRSAERYLLSCGSTILPIIYRRSTTDLDAEQSFRLGEITSALEPFNEDTPASLAAILVNDVDHWSQMVRRMDPDQIRIANDYLRRTGLTALRDLADGNTIQKVARSETNRY